MVSLLLSSYCNSAISVLLVRTLAQLIMSTNISYVQLGVDTEGQVLVYLK